MFGKKVLSIDFGSKNLKLVQAKIANKNITIEKTEKIELPDGYITNGAIINHAEVCELIKQTILDKNLKAEYCNVTLNSSDILTREIIVPSVNSEELNSMLRYELEEYLPVNLDNYFIECKQIENIDDNDLKKQRVFVAVAPKVLVNKYIELVKDIKLKPLVMDINTNAVSKLFIKENKCNKTKKANIDETCAIIDIGYSNMCVTVITNEAIQLSRLFEYGGNDLDVNIANAFNFTIKQAEELKHEGLINLLNEADRKIVDDINNNFINKIIEDINRIFRYYTNKNRGNQIDKLYICGGISNLKGLAAYISNSLELPVLKFDKLNSIRFNKKESFSSLECFVNAIGTLYRME
ncbi:type IV pilus assembly protein PilM [Abyssisolibacter fermentans]|uniref:type IV pilus assembly protein PilM n=1 Tax=Abyssisolibacter fermentans TaxID=1766203 RepID=UPI000836830C|nr:type IV pilus assembly protein PilM [Abyssisolibacter fermentans]